MSGFTQDALMAGQPDAVLAAEVHAAAATYLAFGDASLVELIRVIDHHLELGDKARIDLTLWRLVEAGALDRTDGHIMSLPAGSGI